MQEHEGAWRRTAPGEGEQYAEVCRLPSQSVAYQLRVSEAAQVVLYQPARMRSIRPAWRLRAHGRGFLWILGRATPLRLTGYSGGSSLSTRSYAGRTMAVASREDSTGGKDAGVRSILPAFFHWLRQAR